MTEKHATKQADAARPSRRVVVLGATGTVGRAAVAALARRGHDVIGLVRPRRAADAMDSAIPGVTLRACDVTDPDSLRKDGFRDERFDAVVSCLASRTGAPDDAWAIDYQANLDALAVAKAAGVPHMVVVSAICVQKPRLAFQRAKLAFEAALRESGMRYSIVRPTAFFKSLSGQIERVRRGKPFLVFGDGRLTACKPISDGDLARFIAECLEDPARWNRTLPIGGPGPAFTPREQGERLFALLGREPRFRKVPVAALTTVAGVLSGLGRVRPALAAKAELARIGHYYATESMLVLDPATGCYDADATPSYGSETLFDYYEKILNNEATVEYGAHTVLDRGRAAHARDADA